VDGESMTQPLKLSVVIPAHNEAGSIRKTVTDVSAALDTEGIDYEVIVVDDGSTDGTGAAVEAVAAEKPRVRTFRSHYGRGFGLAVRAGLDRFEGDAVAIVMGDAPMTRTTSSATSACSRRATTAPSDRASCRARSSATTRR
jgi:dolichol-phosphate mannosyltransferase